MLALNDPRWSQLTHAYGPATDTPGLLTRISLDPGPTGDTTDERWFELWSSLYHQGDAYSAAYASVPHIVGIALAAKGPIAFDFFLLPAAIEIARLRSPGTEIPPFLADSYRDALYQRR